MALTLNDSETAAGQATASATALRSNSHVSGRMTRARSAIGMNSDGGTMPRPGKSHRAKASSVTSCPEPRS